MSVNASPFAQIVPAGIGPNGTLRAAILVLPRQPTGTTADIPLPAWPSKAHALIDSIKEAIVRPKAGPGLGADQPWQISRPPRTRTPSGDVLTKLDDLWARIMAGGPGGVAVWSKTLAVWDAPRPAAPPAPEAAILPLPTAEAGLAIPLERGRALLEALAEPDSPLLARAPTRPPASAIAAIGRPWLGEAGPTTLFAARQADVLSDRDRDRLFGPPDVGEWLAARAAGDRTGHRGGDLAYVRPLDPEALARDALGEDERDMLDVFDRMHALHHAAMNGVAGTPGVAAAAAIPTPSPEETRRVAQLMASPSLMRLFGFARDVLVVPPPGVLVRGTSYWCLRIGSHEADDRGCAAKLTIGTPADGFYPVPRAEWNGSGGTPPAAASDRVAERDGLVILGSRRAAAAGGTRPDHAIITLEPALAIESDTNRQVLAKDGDLPKNDPLTGGLALVRLGVSEVDPVINAPIRCSEELRTFDRLDVGLVVADGTTRWRCVQHRHLEWSDPSENLQDPRDGLMEKALRDLGTGALHRYELDAASCTRAAITPVRDQSGTPACYLDQRVAIYDGYPGGGATNVPYWAPPARNKAREPGWAQKPVTVAFKDGLALNQTISVPTARADGAEAAAVPLRARYAYRMGLRRVWVAGITRPLEEAARLYAATGDAPFPPLREGNLPVDGHPYLRHEAIGAPLVTLPPSVPRILPASPHEDTLQTAEQAVVVTWNGAPPPGHRTLRSTARVLLVPPVALEFAALHEVFDNDRQPRKHRIQLTEPRASRPSPPPSGSPPPPADRIRSLAIRVPPDMLRRLRLEGEVKAHDSSVGTEPYGSARTGTMPRLSVLPQGVEDDRAAPYYPDPAAAYLAIGLREASGEGWAVPPRLVRLRGGATELREHPWPSVLPIHAEVQAAERGARTLAIDPAPVWLAMPAPHSTHVRRVRIGLGPGERVVLEAWLVPGVEDLADWFDVCDGAARLAVAAGGGAANDRACRDGLELLLGQRACAALPPGGDSAEARRQVASLLWARLAEGPVEIISKVRRISLLHAVRNPAAAPSMVPGAPLTLARRLDIGDAATATFLAAAPGPEPDEDGAVQPVIWGDLMLDLATTAGLVVEAVIASPDRALDPIRPATSANLVPLSPPPLVGRDPDSPDNPFPGLLRRVELLRIEGIPSPPGGSAVDQRVSLRDLQRQAARGTIPGLTAVRGAPLADGGARRARLHVTALPRHAATVQRPGEVAPPDARRTLDLPTPLWLNATIRPAAPDPKELVPTFSWSEAKPAPIPGRDLVWTHTRDVGLRLTLRRPWFSAGEDEEPALIVWPPAGSTPPQLASTPLDDETLARLIESDIGPLGPFVSAWARDPLRDPDPAGAPAHFPLRHDHFDTGARGAETWRDNVLIPVAGGELNRGLEGEILASILRLPLRYDRHADLWFADIPLLPAATARLTDRFVRLGLVRWQEHARPDRDRGSGAHSIRCSPPASIWTVMPPRRHLTVTAIEGADGHSTLVSVLLQGPGDAPRTGATPTTAVSMAVLETRGGRETVARNEQAQPLEADTLNKGLVFPESRNGERHWSASFRIPLRRSDVLRRHAVVVEEFDAMPAADGYRDAAGDPPPVRRAGTRFFARVDLVPG